jgi:hypothetical protein
MSNLLPENDPQNWLLKPDYQSSCKTYPINRPAIETGYDYFFKTASGLLYEVRFARKSDNYLGIVVNFTVVSDEFEHDYPVTNRGEIYNVIATVIEIIKIFHQFHIFTNSYEFSGEFKEDENKEDASIRSRLYYRYAQQILNKNWQSEMKGNKVFLKKM